MKGKKNRKWHAIFKMVGTINGVEVGVHRGDNSKNLLRIIPTLKLVMVDKWAHDTYEGKDNTSAGEKWQKLYQDKCERNYKIAVNSVKKYKKRYKIVRGDSAESAALFEDGFFDFCFIDADHSYDGVIRDIKAWFPKVKSGGFICGHDYEKRDRGKFGVKKAVDDTFGGAVITSYDNTWFVRVK